MTDTKEKIMQVAAKMFSERGYDKVTTREIAKAIGINSASIYHHFSSKGDILKTLYAFYCEQRHKGCPDLNELMQLAETHKPLEVLSRTTFHFDEDVREMLDATLITAARRICADAESERFIRENIFEQIEQVLRPLLQHMVNLKKIKPLDIDIFIRTVSYYCFSAASLNNTPFRQDPEEYRLGMEYIFSMVVVENDSETDK